MHIPASTYRVQLHKNFTLLHLGQIIDYLHQLGVSAIYASPIVQSTPGSMHGYDVTDPHTLDHEIGTLEELESLAQKLKSLNMSWVQDIVPNHMAFNTLNFRLMDVLERGPHSSYYNYFDINWDHPSPVLHGRLGVPFLGREPDECIHEGELKLSFSDKGLTVDYLDTHYPLSLKAYPELFSGTEELRIDWHEFLTKGAACDYEEWIKYKKNFIQQIFKNEGQYKTIRKIIAQINADKRKLYNVFNLQHYVLQHWKVTEKEINYRRFFTVNELICLRMEDETVFDDYHAFFHFLYKHKIIQGIRIDHIDGLKDPSQYIRRLRNLFGEACYIIAEKILEADEKLPSRWPLQGTSGYEFLSNLSQLMTDRQGAGKLIGFYRSIVPALPSYKELVTGNKKMILERYMGGEWNNLAEELMSLRPFKNFKRERMKKALALLMISLPVYRIYPEALPLEGEGLRVMSIAFQNAVSSTPACIAELEHLHQLFVMPLTDEELKTRVLSFLQRVMQFTGPLTAKGVEDTTFYIYNALISHDEVGDTPSSLGISIANFHKKMQARQVATPASLSATATHDTKRGEDARLRLNVLCEFPEEWEEHVKQWLEMNKHFHKKIDGRDAPVLNDEYYIYQAIVGGFPEDFTITDEWMERLQEYHVKKLREAKMYSEWAAPDTGYEEACRDFILGILSPGSSFLESFLPFIRKACASAAVYALSQVLIKVTAPGIPDIYQGCELFDLSFVDPDNRRPVDFPKRLDYLREIIAMEQEDDRKKLFGFLKKNRDRGVEKLFVTWKALNFRKAHSLLFSEGSYEPLVVSEKDAVVMGYSRYYDNEWAIVIVPLGLKGNIFADTFRADDYVLMPENSGGKWRNVFTGDIIETGKRLPLSRCLDQFPVALLTNEKLR